MHTLIIGGGAAGLAAAVSAAQAGERVTVLERLDRVGKKLLATGNGRCNLMNTGPLRYPGHPEFAEAVLSRCGAEAQRRFWNDLGLRLREEDAGRVYPASGQASTVLDTLRRACSALRVDIRCGERALSLSPAKGGWTAVTESARFTADRVIVTGGGRAQPKLGSDGSAYALLTAQGHTLREPRPALTQIETETAPIAGLSGIRVRCAVETGGHRETGELLFADYGVSGVCVMQCARSARPGQPLRIDLLPALGMASAPELARELTRRRALWPEEALDSLFTGLCVPRLGLALLRSAGVAPKGRPIRSLTEREAETLAKTAARFTLTVRGIRGFEHAQVTRGGIDPGEFDPATMESRLAPGLYAAGEVLDVDGDCGGYNLMFAFATGILAGRRGLVTETETP